MRVLHVQKTSGVGGSERHLQMLLPALAAAGHEVGMCVAGIEDFRRFVAPLEENGIRTSVVRAGPDLNPALYLALLRQIRLFRPDIVHTHLVHADVHGQPAAKTLGVPSVSSVHSVHDFLFRQPYNRVLRTTGKIPKRIVAISDYVARALNRAGIGDPGALRVVPYGIDPTSWATSNVVRIRERERLGLAPDDVVVGIASRLIEGKGHEFLLDAVDQAIREARHLRLVVVGEGPLRGALEERARTSEARVDFLGFLPDVRPFMIACDALAFPTSPGLGEGFGLAALEAMAASRPVIATRVGALPEVVVDGQTGVLVSPDSLDELAAALVLIAREPATRRAFGDAASQRARQVFSLDHMVERTLEVYDETLGGKRD